ncbi:hypothetical protein ABUL04_20180 [Micromonospora harpali]|uniref:Uncharacterized protein n=1 Tax=Micromonospora harpali TaxID=1490225 RepID=A0ABW1HJK4_9ACTN|nr:hypothetical protein [Micromonospora sp. NBRC 110038]
MLKRIRFLLAVAVTASAALMVPASPAQAAPTAYLDKTQWLVANPNSSMAKSCQSRSITLFEGSYGWGFVRGTEEIWLRNITLTSGTYTWEACLEPHNGIYYFTTVLDGPSVPADTDLWTTVSADGNWNWGSYLDPHF